MEGKRLKNIWKGMNYRCNDRGNANYGGRGIKVCSSWKKSFLSFKKWALKNGYANVLQIDREDNNGSYKPSNCRWVTRIEQSANRRTTRKIEFKGKGYTTRQFAKKFDLSQDCVNNRINEGWSVERIISPPEKKNNKKFRFKKKLLTLNRIAQKTGMKYDTLHQRIVTNKMTVEEAISKELKQTYNFKGQEFTLPEIAKKFSIYIETLRYRIKKLGMTVEEAVQYSRY